MSSYFMYVLRCSDDTLYTGYTVDVAARLKAHNAGTGAKYTAARRPVALEASARFASKHEAMSAEARFKRLTRDRKLAILAEAQSEGAFTQLLCEELGL